MPAFTDVVSLMCIVQYNSNGCEYISKVTVSLCSVCITVSMVECPHYSEMALDSWMLTRAACHPEGHHWITNYKLLPINQISESVYQVGVENNSFINQLLQIFVFTSTSIFIHYYPQN